MPDIRSFFGPKGGGPPKPLPKKVEEPPKARRGRKVIEDSDDDAEPTPAPLVNSEPLPLKTKLTRPRKPATKAAVKKKAKYANHITLFIDCF